MKLVYEDLLKSLIEEEILMVKYDCAFDKNIKVKEFIAVWDQTHNIKKLYIQLNKQMTEFAKTQKISKRLKASEINNEFYPTLLGKLGSFTAIALDFTENEMHILDNIYGIDDPEISKYAMMGIGVCFQLREVYLMFMDFLDELKVPKFMQEALDNINDYFDKAMDHYKDFDKLIKLTMKIHKYIQDTMSQWASHPTELSIEEAPKADKFLNFLISFDINTYILLLMLEKIHLLQDQEEGIVIKPQSYKLLHEREKKLENLRTTQNKPEN
ncbi:hypothetical protein [Williamsoniiplasma lucivorax]|uniref:Uncharacterized protein n=1 Tax=Williamsoniiplasma lucivorax TaxID=209274 RepID=A0A2S5REA0_9MOLU|nr:hypothetical protein [Williamsoniiplasma lucivorax]PPE05542.1 hypothetical protein ELUCI_v1c06350 [Williamsoniiplasma lucivorax]